MTEIKPSTHGIVVEHKESGVRYAVSDRNYNPRVHRKVRDLRPGETVLGYRPRRPQGSAESSEATNPAAQPSGELEKDSKDVQKDTKTEGSAPAGARDANQERN